MVLVPDVLDAILEIMIQLDKLKRPWKPETKQLGSDVCVHVDDVSDGGDELSAGKLHGRGSASSRSAPAGRVCLRCVLLSSLPRVPRVLKIADHL